MTYPEDNLDLEPEFEGLTDHIISNKAYDILRFLVQLLLPGVATLYFTLAQIWGLAGAEEVMGSISAIAIFLGAFMRLSTKSYNASDTKYDGDVVVSTNPATNNLLYSLELYDDPEHIKDMKEVRFRVK